MKSNHYPSDLDRLKREYRARRDSSRSGKMYGPMNSTSLFMSHQRQRAVADLLRQENVKHLRNHKILEIGCGNASFLYEMLTYKASLNNLYGLELIQGRARSTKGCFKHAKITIADAQHLPLEDNSMHIILQSMVFSSILDLQIKQRIARDILRVLKPHGYLIWYDFWINLTNAHTKGITLSDIRDLFPGCQITWRRIMLAPPIAHRIVPYSWTLSLLLHNLRLLNSHYVVLIKSNKEMR